MLRLASTWRLASSPSRRRSSTRYQAPPPSATRIVAAIAHRAIGGACLDGLSAEGLAEAEAAALAITRSANPSGGSTRCSASRSSLSMAHHLFPQALERPLQLALHRRDRPIQ